MGDVRIELRALISDWHGRWHGATRRLATEIKGGTGQEASRFYKRLLRELEGRPSWQAAELVVEHCVPTGAAPTWRRDTLERLAALWYQERGSAPNGYAGRIAVDGVVVREALGSSSAADDPWTRSKLLEQEREAAEQLAQTYQRRLRDLQEEIAEVSVRRSDAEAERDRAQNQFVRNIQALLDQLEAVRAEAEGREARSTELRRQMAELELREQEVRRQRDEARDIADDRYRQLEQVRQEADDEQRRLRVQITELDQHNADLRRALDQEIAGIRDVLREMATDREPASTANAQVMALVNEMREMLRRSQEVADQRGLVDQPTWRQPARTERGARGSEWMDEDDDWLRPRDRSLPDGLTGPPAG